MLKRLNPRSVVATVAFACFTAGLAMERPSLALIVPGGLVFLALAWPLMSGMSAAKPIETVPKTGDTNA